MIPCFNQAGYLRGALESVRAQTWPALESIVVDDGSTDDTSDVARVGGATMVGRQENQGLSAARNAGLASAHGEYVLFLDADDELLPCPRAWKCCSGTGTLARNFVWTPGTAFFRRDAIRAIGGFPWEHSATADYAVLLTLARRGQLIVEPREVVWYRKHERSMSADAMLMLRAALGTLNRERREMPREYLRALTEGRRCWQDFYVAPR